MKEVDPLPSINIHLLWIPLLKNLQWVYHAQFLKRRKTCMKFWNHKIIIERSELERIYQCLSCNHICKRLLSAVSWGPLLTSAPVLVPILAHDLTFYYSWFSILFNSSRITIHNGSYLYLPPSGISYSLINSLYIFKLFFKHSFHLSCHFLNSVNCQTDPLLPLSELN